MRQGTLKLEGDITARKHGGNPNSRAASRNTNRERDCNRILDYLRERGWEGATCEEISIALTLPYQTASGRCADLKYRSKLIIDSGRKRPTRTGNSASVLILIVGGKQ